MRRAKQLIYGSVYLGIIALLLFVVYLAFIRSGPGCNNGRKDSGEEGVDCGGVCTAVCLPANLKPVAVQNVSIFSPIPGKLSILAKLVNPNPALAAKDVPYELRLLGTDGSAKKIVAGHTYVYAGEVKYLAEFVDSIDPGSIRNAELQLGPPQWAKAEDYAKPEFSIQDRRMDIATTTLTISGKLISEDTVRMPKISLVAIFYAKGVVGRPVGVSATELEGMSPGDMRVFAIVHPNLESIDPNRYDVIVSARRP